MQMYDKFEGVSPSKCSVWVGNTWTNMSLKSSGLEDYFPFEMACFFWDMLVFEDVDATLDYQSHFLIAMLDYQSVVIRPWPYDLQCRNVPWKLWCFLFGTSIRLEYFLVLLFGFERCSSYSSIFFFIFQK